eukprot:2504425-Pleurochrysis_carterae.AAC.2
MSAVLDLQSSTTTQSGCSAATAASTSRAERTDVCAVPSTHTSSGKTCSHARSRLYPAPTAPRALWVPFTRALSPSPSCCLSFSRSTVLPSPCCAAESASHPISIPLSPSASPASSTARRHTAIVPEARSRAIAGESDTSTAAEPTPVGIGGEYEDSSANACSFELHMRRSARCRVGGQMLH